MANYRKLVAALVSIGVFAIQMRYGFNFGPVSADIMTVLLLAMNPFAVWLFPNGEV